MSARGWTQAEAAAALGIDQGRVSKLLSGSIAMSEPIRRLCLCYLRYKGLRPNHLTDRA